MAKKKVKSKKSGKKKSNNPFKMWGSWIGQVIYVLLLFTLPIFISNSGYKDCLSKHNINSRNCGYDYKNCPDVIECKQIMWQENDRNDLISEIAGFPSGLFIEPRSVNMIPDFSAALKILFFNLIFYFLVGWGVHLFIRNFKNVKS